MDILGLRGRWNRWRTLARNVRLERPDPDVWLQARSMRVAAALVVSYVVVLTVGMVVVPDGTRTPQPKPPLGPAPALQTHDVIPGPPSLLAPGPDGPSKHAPAPDTSPDTRPTGLAGQPPKPHDHPGAAEPPAAQRQQVFMESTAPIAGAEAATPNASVGPRPALAVAAGPGAGISEAIRSVTGITLWGTPSRPWVSITATGPVRYQLRNVEPDWVVVDLSRAQLALASGKPPEGRGLVKLIRAGQFAPDTVRVVLELTETVSFHVATSPDRTAVIVSLGGLGSRKPPIEPRHHMTVPPERLATARRVGSQPPRETR